MISKVANKPPCRDRRLIAMHPCHCLRRLCLALLDQSLVLLKKLYSHALAPAKLEKNPNGRPHGRLLVGWWYPILTVKLHKWRYRAQE